MDYELKVCNAEMMQIINPQASESEGDCFVRWAVELCQVKAEMVFWEQSAIGSVNRYYQQQLETVRAKRRDVDSEYRACLDYARRGR